MLVSALMERRTVSAPGARVGALMLAASVSALVVMVPWRAATKHYHYRGVSGEVRELARKAGFDHALVFVRSDVRDYQSAFNLNPATLDGADTIYALDVGPSNRNVVVARFSDRPVWVIARPHPTSTSRGPLEVVAGPLPAGSVPQ
jgi:hypothetical protein